MVSLNGGFGLWTRNFVVEGSFSNIIVEQKYGTIDMTTRAKSRNGFVLKGA